MDIGLWHNEIPVNWEWNDDGDWQHPGWLQGEHQHEIGGLDLCVICEAGQVLDDPVPEGCRGNGKEPMGTKSEEEDVEGDAKIWETALSRKKKSRKRRMKIKESDAKGEMFHQDVEELERIKEEEKVKKSFKYGMEMRGAEAIKNINDSKKKTNSGDIMALGEPKMKRVSITVDSGASETVANEATFENYELQSSPGSRAGIRYNTAGQGQKPLENLGQIKAGLWTDDGKPRSMLFQIADVKKPLGSVSRI